MTILLLGHPPRITKVISFIKKINKVLLSVVFLTGTSSLVHAQDFMYSQYFNSPLSLNPGMTGYTRYDFRVGTIQRNQWIQRGIPFSTSGIYSDVSIKLGAVKGVVTDGTPTLGIGFLGINDQLGNGVYQIQHGMLSVSYIQPFGEFYRHRLGGGFMAGYYAKSLNTNNLFFANQINELYGFDATKPNFEGELSNRVNTFSIAAGLHYSFLINKKNFLYIGASMYNINQPREQFYRQTDTAQPRLRNRIYNLVGIQIQIAPRLVINPSIAAQYQYGASEFNIGGSIAYQVNSLKSIQGLENPYKTIIYGGLYYRVGDAIIPYAGMRYGHFTGGISYDVNISRLSGASLSNSIRPRATSFEISLVYGGYFSRSQDKRYSLPCKDFY